MTEDAQLTLAEGLAAVDSGTQLSGVLAPTLRALRVTCGLTSSPYSLSL